jgi:uncharacterized protein (TIGR03437 family)
MKTKIVLALLTSAAAFAQTVETIPFRAVLSPANEVPAITNLEATGVGTVWLHIVRDASGRIVSGSADFKVDYRFPGPINITGMHIHRGAAGTNGPVTIDSGLTRLDAQPARGSLVRQGQISATNEAALATATEMLTNPSGFYLNVHTSDNPGGALRAQLERAQMRVFMSLMNPGNEVPAINDPNASAVSTVTMLFTANPQGVLTSATFNFDINYVGMPADTVFTGYHIHRGAAGTNGPVTIDSGITGNNTVAANQNGAGTMNFDIEVNLNAAAQVNTAYDIIGDPGAFYLNLHTRVAPGGFVRGQLRRTDAMVFQQTMLPSNEVPPVTLDATAASRQVIWTLRDDAGRVQAGSVLFDLNYRFPAAVTFTGLHIHNGLAGANGGVTIDTRVTAAAPVVSTTGVGNIYRQVTVSNAAGVATLNTVITDPAAAYVNLHTSANPGGAVREQLEPRPFGLPSIETIISGVSDPAYQTVAPGGLVSVYGRNLTRVGASNAGSPSANAPGEINGTRLIVANRAAPLLSVGARTVAAQVPADVPAGMQPAYVVGPNGMSNTVNVMVSNPAPAVFFDRIVPQGYIASSYRMSDSTYITADNPARSGDTVLLWATGLGATMPALATGIAAGAQNTVAQTPVVTIGGRAATVTLAQALPNSVGLYWMLVRVPEGVTAGLAPVEVKQGTATANPVLLPVR